MQHRLLLSTIPLTAVLAISLGACGSYSSDAGSSGGSSPTTGGAATGGAATGGAATGGAATGGAATGGAASGGAAAGGAPGSGGRIEVPEASCENVTACGGEVAGVWFAQDSCLPVTGIADLSQLGIGCTEADITSGEIAVSGNLTVNTDGTLSDNTNTTAEIVFELEPPCLEVSGTVTRCDRIGIPLAAAGFDEVVCVDSTVTTDGCTCTAKVNQMGGMAYVLGFNAAQEGAFTSANNALTVTGTSPSEKTYDYCVEGEFMFVTPTSDVEFGEVKGQIVLQKQP